MKEELIVRSKVVMIDALRYCENFQEYSYLWLDDKQECLNIFLRYTNFSFTAGIWQIQILKLWFKFVIGSGAF